MRVKINEPIWNGEKVGIKKSLLSGEGTLEVEVLYKDKNGNRVFPHLYTMTFEKASFYPTHPADGRKPALVYIPIDAFDASEIVEKVLTKEQKEENEYRSTQGLPPKY